MSNLKPGDRCLIIDTHNTKSSLSRYLNTICFIREGLHRHPHWPLLWIDAYGIELHDGKTCHALERALLKLPDDDMRKQFEAEKAKEHERV